MSYKNKINSKLSEFASYIANNKVASFYLAVICIFGFAPSAYADWFQVGGILQQILLPLCIAL